VTFSRRLQQLHAEFDHRIHQQPHHRRLLGRHRHARRRGRAVAGRHLGRHEPALVRSRCGYQHLHRHVGRCRLL
jgi:hypothetical protein